jgi:hypothetical protein
MLNWSGMLEWDRGSIYLACPGVFGLERMLYCIYLARSLDWDSMLYKPEQECCSGTDFSLYPSRSVGMGQDTLYTCPMELGWDRILYLPVQWSWAGPVCSR